MEQNNLNKPLKKNSLFKYFEIYKDKFFKILGLNAIFFMACLVLTMVIFGTGYLVQNIFGTISNFIIILIGLPLVLLAPLVATIIKLCRDYVREVPGFFIEDFKNAFKSNFKQSLLTGIFQYAVLWILFIAIYFYHSISADFGILRNIGLGMCILAAIVFVMMSYYVYMMIVTLDLKLREIYKNAMIFSFLCLFKNIFLTVILALWIGLAVILGTITFYSQNGLIYGFFFLYLILVFFGFIFYTVSFFSYPQIKRYILDPYYEQHPEKSSASVKGKIEAAEIKESAENKELPEFVYHNGKMVHRSAFEQEQMFTDVDEDK